MAVDTRTARTAMQAEESVRREDQQTAAAGLIPPIPSPEEWQARADKLARLLAEWMADESGYDEEALPWLMRALDEDRLRHRKLFPELRK